MTASSKGSRPLTHLETSSSFALSVTAGLALDLTAAEAGAELVLAPAGLWLAAWRENSCWMVGEAGLPSMDRWGDAELSLLALGDVTAKRLAEPSSSGKALGEDGCADGPLGGVASGGLGEWLRLLFTTLRPYSTCGVKSVEGVVSM